MVPRVQIPPSPPYKEYELSVVFKASISQDQIAYPKNAIPCCCKKGYHIKMSAWEKCKCEYRDRGENHPDK